MSCKKILLFIGLLFGFATYVGAGTVTGVVTSLELSSDSEVVTFKVDGDTDCQAITFNYNAITDAHFSILSLSHATGLTVVVEWTGLNALTCVMSTVEIFSSE